LKISQRLIVLFLISALIPLVCVGVLSSYLSSKALTKQITNQITSVNQRQENRLQLINERNQEVLGVFTAKLRLKLLLQSAGSNLSASQFAELKSIETSYVAENSSLNDVSILDPTGHVLSTTASDIVGKDFSGDEMFAAAQKGPTTSIFHDDSGGGGPEVYLAAPLTLDNKLLGYALLESVSNGYLSVVQDYDELGSTGETYIVRPYKTSLLSSQLPLRFNNQAAMAALNPSAEMAIKASKPSKAFSYVDYRNHQVLATVSNLPQTDWKVIVKIDKKEVLAPVRNFLKFVYAISLLTILTTIIMAWWFSRIITRPLKRFTAVVERIQGGDMQQRVQVDSRDEIGQLGVAFNEMTSHLIEAQANLEGSIFSLSQGFIILGTDGGIHTSNPSAQKLLQLQQPPRSVCCSARAMNSFRLPRMSYAHR
jgi:HAMP domain-containing protein